MVNLQIYSFSYFTPIRFVYQQEFQCYVFLDGWARISRIGEAFNYLTRK